MHLTAEQKQEVHKAKFNLRGRRGKRNWQMRTKEVAAAKEVLSKYDIEYTPKWMKDGKL